MPTFVETRERTKSGPVRRHPLDRLADKFTVGDGCWEWKNPTPSGYGNFAPDHIGKPVRAHRYVYELLVGSITEGLVLDHLCRNRACVRPDHLEPVTRGENTLRGETITAANLLKTHCPKGHAYDESNTYRAPGSANQRRCRTCLGI